MRCRPILSLPVALAGGFALLSMIPPAGAAASGPATAVVVAGDDDSAATDRDHRCRVRVIRDGGETETVEIDLSGIGAAIGAAMQEVSRALAELDTVQVVSERHGKRLIIREDDHEAVIDVDSIMGEVNEALALAFAEVGDHAHGARRDAIDRDRRDTREVQARRELRAERDDGRAALRAEIDSLRRELADLQAELKASRDRR